MIDIMPSHDPGSEAGWQAVSDGVGAMTLGVDDGICEAVGLAVGVGLCVAVAVAVGVSVAGGVELAETDTL